MNSYKIFFDEFQILLISQDIELSPEKKMIMHAEAPDDIEPLVYLIKKHLIRSDVIVLCSDVKATYSYLKSNFFYIRAAGGIVRNRKSELLFILKNNRWDLPKGKIDKGESKWLAALREIKEECGIEKLQIIKKVSKTYHIAKLRGRYILKKTTWYEVLCTDPDNLKPDTNEGITDLKWTDPLKNSPIMNNIYRNLHDLLDKYFELSEIK